VSELSESDSDTTVQEDDDVMYDAATHEDEEAELTVSHAEGRLKDKDGEVLTGGPGPWFQRPPSNVSVTRGRTMSSQCLVAGDQPIG